MKKLTALVILFVLATPVFAQHRHHHPHHWNHFHNRHWHQNHNWVVPALIGGAVVYAATRPAPVIVQQPSVIIHEPTVVLQSNQVLIDGVIYNRVRMIINGVEQDVLVKNVQVSNLGSN